MVTAKPYQDGFTTQIRGKKIVSIMRATDTKKSLTSRKPKDKKTDQQNTVFQCFFDSPKTMKEVDKSIGVMRENICRYVRTFRKEGRISVIRRRFCEVTKHLANEYTTNPELFPKPTQLTLFIQ